MRRRIAVLTMVVAAAPPTASAETIKLGWREDDGVGVMRFTVSALTLADGRWSVRGSYTNLSHVPLRIVERRFGLTLYPSPRLAGPSVRLYARRFEPGLPRRLMPGRTWSGTFGGSGTPRRGAYVRVLFGRFQGAPSPLPDFPNGFSWLTAHYHLRK